MTQNMSFQSGPDVCAYVFGFRNEQRNLLLKEFSSPHGSFPFCLWNILSFFAPTLDQSLNAHIEIENHRSIIQCCKMCLDACVRDPNVVMLYMPAVNLYGHTVLNRKFQA